MKAKILLLFMMLGVSVFSQVPNTFSYQAVLRNTDGQILENSDVVLRISLLSEVEIYYVETHTLTTNAYGVVNISIGGGDLVSGSFSSVPWGESVISIKTEVDYQSAGFQEMGTAILQSVPYAHYAKTVGSIDSSPDAGEEDPIFVVKNKDGFIVFAVYQNGVRMYVEETPGKGTRGGFAIGGIGDNLKLGNEYFRVTPDSVRVYLREPVAKGSRGGFAIGGIGDNLKGEGGEYLYLTPENYFIGHQSGENITPEGLYNSTLGYQAGKSLTTGKSNILIGMEAGLSTTTGRWNTVLGFKAGRDNISGDFNTFLGYYAGWKNTTGGSNVFIGNQSGQANETGSNNVFLGYYSGLNNYASFNTFLGYQTGLSNTTGTYNAFMGYNAGQANITGNNNVYIGNEAGYSNQYGFSNVFVGDGAGRQGTSSAWNVFVGYQSGYNTYDVGSHNVFLGHLSGFSNTTGWSNNFIGQGAGYSNTTGTNNIFIGNDAGYSNLVSAGNIFMGRNAGYNSTEYGNTIIGHTAGQNLATGTNNTFLGSLAGYQRSGGDGNLILGSYANYAGGSGNNNTVIGNAAGYSVLGSGNVIIGYNAGFSEEGDNKLYISNSSSSSPLIYGEFSNMVVIKGNAADNVNTRNFFVNGSAGGTGSWWNDSDGRLKHNILPIANALSKVLALRGVTYEWNNVDTYEAGSKIGFIAQEAKEVVPELVAGSDETKYSMQYAPITALLVEAIKEQQAKILALESELKKVKGENDELNTQKAEMIKLQSRITEIENLLKK